MTINTTKITNRLLFNQACSFTAGKLVSPDLKKMYRSEHSPIRTQVFWIELYGIPTFASVHLVRHKIGVDHYVQSNRDDRPGHTEHADRNTPTNHAMLINAQALINMSRKRLCGKAHEETRNIMREIKKTIEEVDPDLAKCMVPECEYRGRCCELKPCEKQCVRTE